MALAFRQVAGADRAVLDDVGANPGAGFLVILAEPFPPPVPAHQPAPGAGEFRLPVAVELDRDHRGIMRPVLEQGAFPLDMVVQPFRLVGSRPGKQDVVMGPLHGADAVHLHETDAMDQRRQILPPERTARRIGQRVQLEKESTCVAVGYDIGHEVCFFRTGLPDRNIT